MALAMGDLLTLPRYSILPRLTRRPFRSTSQKIQHNLNRSWSGPEGAELLLRFFPRSSIESVVRFQQPYKPFDRRKRLSPELRSILARTSGGAGVLYHVTGRARRLDISGIPLNIIFKTLGVPCNFGKLGEILGVSIES